MTHSSLSYYPSLVVLACNLLFLPNVNIHKENLFKGCIILARYLKALAVCTGKHCLSKYPWKWGNGREKFLHWRMALEGQLKY